MSSGPISSGWRRYAASTASSTGSRASASSRWRAPRRLALRLRAPPEVLEVGLDALREILVLVALGHERGDVDIELVARLRRGVGQLVIAQLVGLVGGAAANR